MKIGLLVGVALLTAASAVAQEGTPPVRARLLPPPVSATQPAVEVRQEALQQEAVLVPEMGAVAVSEPQSDTKPTARVIGVINADAVFVGQSLRNQQIFGVVDNSVGFRRVRWVLRGKSAPFTGPPSSISPEAISLSGMCLSACRRYRCCAASRSAICANRSA